MRGTTPTHTFTIPFDTNTIDKVRIIYSQDGKEVLRKLIGDCEIGDKDVKTTLTQEDTFKFDCTLPVEIQMRILTKGGETINSHIEKVGVARCLDNEVLV